MIDQPQQPKTSRRNPNTSRRLAPPSLAVAIVLFVALVASGAAGAWAIRRSNSDTVTNSSTIANGGSATRDTGKRDTASGALPLAALVSTGAGSTNRGATGDGVGEPAGEASNDRSDVEGTPVAGGGDEAGVRIVEAEQGEPAVVEVTTPGGAQINLVDSAAEIIADADGTITDVTEGVAVFDLPTVGPLAGAFMDRLLAANVGMATGAELHHLGAHLRDDSRYLYFDIGRQAFDLHLDLEQSFAGAETLPERISTTGDMGPSMFVMDVSGDYFYLSTPCASLVPAGNGKKARPSKQREATPADRVEDIPGVSLDLSGFDPGGCGIGWSAGGLIPFRPMMQDRVTEIPNDFSSHLVIDGTIPVHPSASLDGEIFVRFDQDRMTAWANSELDLTVSFAEGVGNIAVPVAKGTVGVSVGVSNFDLWVTSTVGTTAADGSPAAQLAGLLPRQGGVDIDAEIHFVGAELQSSSFVQLDGELAISNGNAVTEASGVAMGDVVTADAFARIDFTGIEVRGSVEVSPISAFDVSGSAELDFMLPFDDPANGYFDLRGDIAIGEIVLEGNARVRIDRTGAFASGELAVAGMANVAVEGFLGANGFQLTGEATATLPIGDLDRVAANLVDETANARVIQLLNAQIDERVEELAAANPSKATELRNTVRDFRNAFADVAVANENIRINNAKIADVQRRISADIAWHHALSDFDRFWDTGPHGVRLAALYAEQGVFEAANAGNYAYRDTANAILSTSQQVALGVVGWDAELNALVTLQAEAYWGTLTGNFVATVLHGADAVLDAFGVDGSATGTVSFTVGTEGIGATAQLEWCRDGRCETLAGAVVELAPDPTLCGMILGQRVCAPLP